VNEIKGATTLRGVQVSVHPGGSLVELSLSRTALALGAEALAATVLEAVSSAKATADGRARVALAAAGADLSVLGPVEEFAIPTTWRVS
jgi:hypothetical protein